MMRPLQIIADPLETGDMLRQHTPELNEEIEEEVGDINTLPNPYGNTGRC